MSFVDAGEHEALKGFFHGWLFGAAVPVWTYNGKAVVERGEIHHWINFGLLTLLIGAEVINIRRHFK